MIQKKNGPQASDIGGLPNVAFDVPADGVELARSRVCSQAFRAGEVAWGVQFHPEVRLDTVERWFAEEETVRDGPRVLGELTERINEWEQFGASLCRAFLAAASRGAPQVPVSGAGV